MDTVLITCSMVIGYQNDKLNGKKVRSARKIE